MAAKRILVADSDARRRRVTATLLKLAGYDVVEAGRLAEVAEAGSAGVDALVTEAELSDGGAVARASRDGALADHRRNVRRHEARRCAQGARTGHVPRDAVSTDRALRAFGAVLLPPVVRADQAGRGA